MLDHEHIAPPGGDGVNEPPRGQQGVGQNNLTSTLTFDAVGNPTVVNGARTDVTDQVATAYDAERRPTQSTDALGKMTRLAYDADGRVIRSAAQIGTQWLVSCRNYTANTAAAGATISHDTNGNLTGNGTWAYGYDQNNRLKTASKSGTAANLSYDAAGTLQRRWVHGPGVDEPLVAYEGATTASKSWLYADHLGSIVGAADATGTNTAIYSYGPYGEPNTAAGQRFRYTGQQLIGGLDLYYYKARFYDPKLGRFLQTDPIGTQDDMNLYAYVGGNPVNATDPSGMAAAQAKILAGDLTGSVNNWWDASKAGFQSSTMGEAAMKLVEGFSPTAGMAVGVGATKLGGTVSRIFDAAKGAAQSSKQAADLSRHLRYAEKYGADGVKQLENGRFRYYGEVQPANKAGEMAGRRYVHEFDPASGGSRGWHETVDHAGTVRQVRPELNNGTKTHYRFDSNGNYTGSW